MKKFRLDATTIVEPLPDDYDLVIKVVSPKEVIMRINKDRVYHVLASLDMILATINSRGKTMIQHHLEGKAVQEEQIRTAIRKQTDQELIDNAIDKASSDRRKRG